MGGSSGVGGGHVGGKHGGVEGGGCVGGEHGGVEGVGGSTGGGRAGGGPVGGSKGSGGAIGGEDGGSKGGGDAREGGGGDGGDDRAEGKQISHPTSGVFLPTKRVELTLQSMFEKRGTTPIGPSPGPQYLSPFTSRKANSQFLDEEGGLTENERTSMATDGTLLKSHESPTWYGPEGRPRDCTQLPIKTQSPSTVNTAGTAGGEGGRLGKGGGERSLDGAGGFQVSRPPRIDSSKAIEVSDLPNSIAAVYRPTQ